MGKIVLALIEKDVNKFMLAMFITCIGSILMLLFVPLENELIMLFILIGLFTGVWILMTWRFWVSERNKEKLIATANKDYMLNIVPNLNEEERKIIKACSLSPLLPIDDLLVQGLIGKRVLLVLSQITRYQIGMGQMAAFAINPDFEPYLKKEGVF